MTEYYPKGNLKSNFNVYGYAVAQTLEQVLRQAGDVLTRENIMKQAANLQDLEIDTLLPGIKIDTSATDFRPIEAMQPVKFDGETWVPFGPIISAGPGA